MLDNAPVSEVTRSPNQVDLLYRPSKYFWRKQFSCIRDNIRLLLATMTDIRREFK